MSTTEALADAPPVASESTPAPATEPTPAPLWPGGMKIEVLGLTGEFESGKTLFGLSIDPANTLCFDMEKSSGCYEGLGFTRVDMADVMLSKFGARYTPVDVFNTWNAAIDAITPGKFRVIMLDPVSEVESGLASWVRANPAKFGKTASQYQKMEGLYWADVKEHWKLMLSKLAAKCECFVFTAHLKFVWSDNRPTRRRTPKGKDTLMELATLYLHLDRTINDKGAKPAIPSAHVLKDRLAHTRINEKTGAVEIVPILPPRLPVANPQAIRKYIEEPANFKKPRKGELAVIETMSDDERLVLDTQRAEAERDRAQAELATKQLAFPATTQAAATATSTGTTPPAATQPATPAGPAPAPTSHANGLSPLALEQAATTDAAAPWEGGTRQAEAGPAVETNGKCSPEQYQQLVLLKEALAMPEEAWQGALAKRGVNYAGDLTQAQAIELADRMTAMLGPQPVAAAKN